MPEPTRQSLSGCCSQPEHGPTQTHQMSQGRKKNVARPGLEPRVFGLPCEHSTTELPSHMIDQLQFPPPNVTVGKRMWPDRDSNPGSLAYRASHMIDQLHMNKQVTGHTDTRHKQHNKGKLNQTNKPAKKQKKLNSSNTENKRENKQYCK